MAQQTDVRDHGLRAFTWMRKEIDIECRWERILCRICSRDPAYPNPEEAGREGFSSSSSDEGSSPSTNILLLHPRDPPLDHGLS